MDLGLEPIGQNAGDQVARQMLRTGFAKDGLPLTPQALPVGGFQVRDLCLKIARMVGQTLTRFIPV
ncbi:MAG TPA: hypothetical protein VJP60_02245 [Rhizomicrobium sp.]|nr:hypothetical protein [Rhizomicrobium sp.]